MSFDFSLSSINVARFVQNYSLDNPDLATALAKEENYSIAKELFLHLLKDESLLELNKPLIIRLIKLIKPEDLNGPLGKGLQQATQKLHDLGVFKLMNTSQALNDFHPTALWMVSEHMRKKWKKNSGLISFAELAAKEAKFSAHVVRLIREYEESRKLVPLLKSLLQSVNSKEHLSLLQQISNLSKLIDLDGFQKDFKRALQICQIDLVPFFNFTIVDDYQKLAQDYALATLNCRIDQYTDPIYQRMHAVELREDAKNHLINSKSDLEACCANPEDVKSITWGYEYPLTKKKLGLLKSHCTGLREFILDARSLKRRMDFINGFPYLENVTICQSDQPVCITEDIRKLTKCRAIKLKGFLIDETLLEKLVNLPHLESLDISMCELDAPFYLFFKIYYLRCLSLPFLHQTDELLSTYLHLLGYYKVIIHLSPTQSHLLDKKMSQTEFEKARKQAENMIFSFLNEENCSSYFDCATKYRMNRLLAVSAYYIENSLKSLDCKIQMLDFFIENSSFRHIFSRLRDYTIISLPLDFAHWKEYAQKGKDSGFDALVKRANYCLQGPDEGAKNYTINSNEDLKACCANPEDVKSVTWGYEYPLTPEKLEQLKCHCPGLREFILDARSLKRDNVDLINEFSCLENVTICQSDQPVSITEDILKLTKCQAIKLKGFLIDEVLLEKLVNLPQLERLDISMCKLDVPIYLFFKFSRLKYLSLPLLHHQDALLSTYLQLLVYHGVSIHLSSIQSHLLEKKMSELEAKKARDEMENMFLSFLSEQNCSSYLACAMKYRMDRLSAISEYYSENKLKKMDCKIRILNFFIENSSFRDRFPRLRDYIITSFPLDFAHWKEYAQKGKDSEFDTLIKRADYCLQGPREDARDISIYSEDDLRPYLDDPAGVKSVELLKRNPIEDLKMVFVHFPAITSLKLNVNCIGKSQFINSLLQRFKKLESLWFTQAIEISFLLNKIPTIKFLRIQKGFVSNENFKSMSYLYQLERLDLRGANLIFISDFNEILKWNQLKEIKFSLTQLLEAPHFSTSILDELCKKGVSLEIDPQNLDLKSARPENVTALLLYAQKTGRRSLEATLTEQLKLNTFEVKKEEDLEKLIKLTSFKEFRLRSLFLFFNDQKDPSALLSVENVLTKLIKGNILIKELKIINENYSGAFFNLNVFYKLSYLKSLKKIELWNWSLHEKNSELNQLLLLPNLKKLKVPCSWYVDDTFRDGFEKIRQRGIKIWFH